MSKKRNKRYQPAQQKIREAQLKNDYFKRLGTFLRNLTGEDVLALIPNAERELIFSIRLSPIEVIPGEGQDINPGVLQVIKTLTKEWFKTRTKTIEKTNKEIPLADFLNYGFPLGYYLTYIQQDKNTEKIKELLCDHFNNPQDYVGCFFNELEKEVFLFLLMYMNKFNHNFYTLELSADQKGTSLRVNYIVQVKKFPAEKIYVELNGNTRPAYRIGWTCEKNLCKWVHVTPAQLGIDSAFANIPIPVYIQMHALERLLERVDCVSFPYLNSSVFLSFIDDCNIIRDKDKYLIEYKVWGVKTGYFVATFKEGKLIVRTFLFLTCKGTPEATRLEQLVGLQKLDTKYLNMDKLSTFMSSKISANMEVRAIFEKASCSHLLELFDKLSDFCDQQSKESGLEMITNYLKKTDLQLDEFASGNAEDILIPDHLQNTFKEKEKKSLV